MTTEPVRVLRSFETCEYDVADQPPPGAARIHIQGRGEFYATPDVLSKAPKAPLRHPQFPADLAGVMDRFADVFKDLCRRTPAEWEESFRRDTHPWREVAYWELAADALVKFAPKRNSKPTAWAERKAVFAVIMSIMNNGRPPGQPGRPFNVLSARQVEKISSFMRSKESQELQRQRRARYRTLLGGDSPALPGPPTVTLAALFNEEGTGPNLSAEFDVRELLETPDVIFGVDIQTGHEMLVFGREVLARVAAGQEGEFLRVLRVEIDADADADDLERLCALVHVVRGRCDYQDCNGRGLTD